MELNKKVADFTLQTDEDKTVSLSDYAGKPVILFFYPRADTPGCTIEACGFRDTFKKLQAAGAVVMGIERTTFVIGPDQTLLHIFPKVTPEGHAEEVLALIKEWNKTHKK